MSPTCARGSRARSRSPRHPTAAASPWSAQTTRTWPDPLGTSRTVLASPAGGWLRRPVGGRGGQSRRGPRRDRLSDESPAGWVQAYLLKAGRRAARPASLRPPGCRTGSVLEGLGRRAGADQVAVTVGTVDPRNRRPVLVRGLHPDRERRGPAIVAVGPILGQAGGRVRSLSQH